MELRLVGEADGPGHGEGEGNSVRELPGNPQLFQGAQFLLQLPAVGPGIDVGVLLLEAAVDLAAELPVLPEGSLLGGEIQPGALWAVLPEELAIDQPMLAGDFGGGVSRDAAAQGFGLRQDIGNPGAVQLVGAQDPRHAAADDQNIGAAVPLQGSESRRFPGLFPE